MILIHLLNPNHCLMCCCQKKVDLTVLRTHRHVFICELVFSGLFIFIFSSPSVLLLHNGVFFPHDQCFLCGKREPEQSADTSEQRVHPRPSPLITWDSDSRLGKPLPSVRRKRSGEQRANEGVNGSSPPDDDRYWIELICILMQTPTTQI